LIRHKTASAARQIDVAWMSQSEIQGVHRGMTVDADQRIDRRRLDQRLSSLDVVPIGDLIPALSRIDVHENVVDANRLDDERANELVERASSLMLENDSEQLEPGIAKADFEIPGGEISTDHGDDVPLETLGSQNFISGVRIRRRSGRDPQGLKHVEIHTLHILGEEVTIWERTESNPRKAPACHETVPEPYRFDWIGDRF
jgi:hypothetical protein